MICSCEKSVRGLYRYDHVASSIAEIALKHTGKIPWGFIVLCTPELAEMDPDAMDFALVEIMKGEHAEICLATFYQAAKRYCEQMRRPEFPYRSSHSSQVLDVGTVFQ